MTARIYLRVSRLSEAGILANQREAAIEYARRQGFPEVLVYSETASGADEEREGLEALLGSIRKDDIVIFTSLSRMTRGGIRSALKILDQLQARGTGWHFTETPILNFDSTTPKLVKDILFAVLAAIDEDYRRRISEATRAKLTRLKDEGKKLGGKRPGAGRKPKVLHRDVKVEPERLSLLEKESTLP